MAWESLEVQTLNFQVKQMFVVPLFGMLSSLGVVGGVGATGHGQPVGGGARHDASHRLVRTVGRKEGDYSAVR